MSNVQAYAYSSIAQVAINGCDIKQFVRVFSKLFGPKSTVCMSLFNFFSKAVLVVLLDVMFSVLLGIQKKIIQTQSLF